MCSIIYLECLILYLRQWCYIPLIVPLKCLNILVVCFYQIHAFFISNTFISNARLKSKEIKQKIKQMLRSTMRLNYCYLKIIHILHPRYHQKLIGHILKHKKENKCVCIHKIILLIVMKMKMKVKNRSHRYDTKRLGLYIDTNMVNIKSVSVWWLLYVLSNMKKVSNTETDLKKSLLIQKVCTPKLLAFEQRWQNR